MGEHTCKQGDRSTKYSPSGASQMFFGKYAGEALQHLRQMLHRSINQSACAMEEDWLTIRVRVASSTAGVRSRRGLPYAHGAQVGGRLAFVHFGRPDGSVL